MIRLVLSQPKGFDSFLSRRERVWPLLDYVDDCHSSFPISFQLRAR
jgi:hypothetical protein